jgi:hypothetical protein
MAERQRTPGNGILWLKKGRELLVRSLSAGEFIHGDGTVSDDEGGGKEIAECMINACWKACPRCGSGEWERSAGTAWLGP